MIFHNLGNNYSLLRQQVLDNYTLDENHYVNYLLSNIRIDTKTETAIQQLAHKLVQQVRTRHTEQKGMNAFMRLYNLSTEEGVVLMCLAESLLRIPDSSTANKLIRDKLNHSNWQRHLGASESLFVNASTWALMISGKMIQLDSNLNNNIYNYFNTLVSKFSENIIRAALKEAMRIMATQFVKAATIEHAVSDQGFYSFDVLGEAALTPTSAERYFNNYLHAIKIAATNNEKNSNNNSISIKLSALHCRYQLSKQQLLEIELYPKLQTIIETAIACNIEITIDAEESNRLDIMLDAFDFMYQIAVKHHWHGLGIAVQAYQFRSLAVLKCLAQISSENRCYISVRLVKGAYWDSEIKIAQQQGYDFYPVFSRKENTDLSYLCNVQYLLNCQFIKPQFATHNAATIAAIIHYAKLNNKAFEFQRLLGMGELLYNCVTSQYQTKVRVYAPIGDYQSLLPYLVRRLLENGANSSFIHNIENPNINIESITRSPIELVKHNNNHYHSNIPLPKTLFRDQRRNAAGINLNDITQIKIMDHFFISEYQKKYFSSGDNTVKSINPANPKDIIGSVNFVQAIDIEHAMNQAQAAFQEWSNLSIVIRVNYLLELSDLIEQHKYELITLVVREAGRCIPDVLAEIREAVDFCRYYAQQALDILKQQKLPGPTGELNILQLRARGIYACISPWNFPIAIFTGQITAALITGNCVLAKPAQQTTLCAAKIIELCYRAGIPKTVLHFIPSSSAIISDTLLQHPNLAGVVFTGSSASAETINARLVARRGAIIPFIAETGGKNAMIVDSSAQLEQVVIDVLDSAFNSAGQRCSSLTFLYLQQEIAEPVIELLCGAVTNLRVADPRLLATDIGPLIDQQAKQKILSQLQYLRDSDFASKILDNNTEINRNANSDSANYFVTPAIYEISHQEQIQHEVFGPVLHIIRYPQSKLFTVIKEINDSGFGLTLGIHSRISSTIDTISRTTKVGNIYVNRNTIGAVVGVQPFGGQRLSGTGPKAGGPHYLKSFCAEQVISTNITAIGGNRELLNSNSS